MMIASSLMCLVILLSSNDVSAFTFDHKFLYLSLLWGLSLLFDVFDCMIFSTTDSDRQSTQILQECTWFLLEFRTDPNGINYKSCKNQDVVKGWNKVYESFIKYGLYGEYVSTGIQHFIKCWNLTWNFYNFLCYCNDLLLKAVTLGIVGVK